jgi:hypothetical protein
MAGFRRTLLLAGALLSTAQAPADRFFHIIQGRRSVVECGGRAISLDGGHTSTHLTGYCPFVRIAGEHNDIDVPVPPGGTIEIDAPHNDVTWRQTAPGPPPNLVALAPSNTFHPN